MHTLCIYTYIYIHTHLPINAYFMHIHIYLHTYTSPQVMKAVNVSQVMMACIHVHIYTHIYRHQCILYVYKHTDNHIFTYIHTSSRSDNGECEPGDDDVDIRDLGGPPSDAYFIASSSCIFAYIYIYMCVCVCM